MTNQAALIPVISGHKQTCLCNLCQKDSPMVLAAYKDIMADLHLASNRLAGMGDLVSANRVEHAARQLKALIQAGAL